MGQARAVAELAARYLRLSFDAGELSELPLALRALSSDLLSSDEPDISDAIAPNW
jgi:hypothetical protein